MYTIVTSGRCQQGQKPGGANLVQQVSSSSSPAPAPCTPPGGAKEGADLAESIRVVAASGAEKFPSNSVPLRHRLRAMPVVGGERRLGLVCRLIPLWEPSSCAMCACLLLRTLCDADSSSLGAQATVQLQPLPNAIKSDLLPNLETSDSEAHSLYPAAQVWSGRSDRVGGSGVGPAGNRG